MSIDLSGVQAFTDAEILTLYRWALATGCAGQQRTINGRSITFPSNEQIRATIEWLETRIGAAASGAGGNIAIVNRGERV